jgi:uncharacterized protein involved in exopolysaccharide biosynthesis
MNTSPLANDALRQFFGHAVTGWRRWLLPAAAVAAVAAVYAVVRPDTWEAAQALMVRNEATSHETAPGKFRMPEEMKTVQETILEVIRSRGVLAAALKEIGPPDDFRLPAEQWPSEEAIVTLRRAVKLSPPKGAEFGKTEVFYLEVRDGDRQRAIALNRALFAQLQARSQELRDAKARSMIAELEKTVQLARADLIAATAQLTATESAVGGDLAELKAMGEITNGDSALRRTATEIRGELRAIRTAIHADRELLALLTDANDDPGRFVAMPNRLLDSQPALRRLKEGLVDAQLQTARLEGRMAAEHPLVRAAREAENEVGRQLHNELATAVRGVEVELRLHENRETHLAGQLAEVNARLDKLAALRADYTVQAGETQHRKLLTERAEQNLAEARAAQASAKASHLINPIDAPDAGIRPIGPSRAMIVLAGIVGGLLTGLGVLLFSLPQPAPGRKQTGAFRAAVPSGHGPAPFDSLSNLPFPREFDEAGSRA